MGDKEQGGSRLSILNVCELVEGFKDTYTCFAPAFIFKSCLMSRMMHFRSLPVHLMSGEKKMHIITGNSCEGNAEAGKFEEKQDEKKIENNYLEIRDCE